MENFEEKELEKFIGCMIALSIGDAVGEIKQHKNNLSIKEIISGQLIYTDDTALSIAITKAIIESNELTTEIIGDYFLKAINSEPNRGYGGLPVIFYSAELNNITYIEARDKANKALRNGDGSFGDGGAMRIAPAALFYSGLSDFYNKVRLITVIDHSHELAVESTFIVASMIEKCLYEKNIDSLNVLEEFIEKSKIKRMKIALELVKKALKENISFFS